jgi:hypothetical protein
MPAKWLNEETSRTKCLNEKATWRATTVLPPLKSNNDKLLALYEDKKLRDFILSKL